MSAPATAVRALLIDDSDVERVLCRRTLERSAPELELLDFAYADEALAYLRRCDRRSIALIILDINMPRMSGFEFLERATAELGELFVGGPVIMLSSSRDPRDVARAGTFGIVADYVAKPMTGEALQRMLELLVAPPDPAATLGPVSGPTPAD